MVREGDGHPGGEQRRDDEDVYGPVPEEQSDQLEHAGELEQSAPEVVRPPLHLPAAQRPGSPNPDEPVPFSMGQKHARVFEEARGGDEDEEHGIEGPR